MQEKIRPGYKQTEVGLIPEDWQCDALDTFWMVTDCKHVTAPFVPLGYPLASIRETQARVVDLSEANHTNEDFYRRMIEGGRKPEVGDLIFSRNATVGEVAQVTAAHPLFAMGQDVCLLRKRKQSYSTDFAQSFLKSNLAVRQMNDAMVGSTFKRMNVAQIKALKVILPPPTEQCAIAEALSDADARIAALEALIAKKRDLKQAAMQQLLTGKTRLPGFSGEWEVKRLGELLDYEQPTKYLVESTEYDESYDVPVLTAGKSFYLGRTNETHGICQDLPVIIFDDFTTATQYVDFPFKAKSSAMKILRQREQDTDLKLVYALMQGIKFTMSDHKRYWISEYQKVELPFPGPEEQAAIAEILFDMDTELATLETEAGKARTIKQGMMQNLLTGKVRLV